MSEARDGEAGKRERDEREMLAGEERRQAGLIRSGTLVAVLF